MIDFHSHILPGIDDGAKDIETAAKMLTLSKSMGVDTVVATPHFYPWQDSVPEFLKKREESYKKLVEYISVHKLDVPEVILGAEVAFSGDILNIDIGKLTIGNTEAILIELPFEYWNEWIYTELYRLSMEFGLDIILAHIERYIPGHRDFTKVEPFFDMNMCIQVNADSFLDRKGMKIIKKLVKRDKLHLIGSDMHNLENRITHMDEAVKKAGKKFGMGFLNEITNNGRKILKG